MSRILDATMKELTREELATALPILGRITAAYREMSDSYEDLTKSHLFDPDIAGLAGSLERSRNLIELEELHRILTEKYDRLSE